MIYDVVITDAAGQARTHRVVLTRTDGVWNCTVDGQPFAFDLAQPENGILSLLVQGQSHEIRRDANGQGTEIVIGSRRFLAEVTDPRSLRGRQAKAGGGEGPKKVKAPMPGKVVRILAAEGTAVEAGQGVVVIEAMKMQNELKSPKAGKVAKLLATEGAAVNAGDVLAIIE